MNKEDSSTKEEDMDYTHLYIAKAIIFDEDTGNTSSSNWIDIDIASSMIEERISEFNPSDKDIEGSKIIWITDESEKNIRGLILVTNDNITSKIMEKPDNIIDNSIGVGLFHYGGVIDSNSNSNINDDNRADYYNYIIHEAEKDEVFGKRCEKKLKTNIADDIVAIFNKFSKEKDPED